MANRARFYDRVARACFNAFVDAFGHPFMGAQPARGISITYRTPLTAALAKSAAVKLAKAAKREGLTRFALQEVPVGMAVAVSLGPIRFVQQFDPVERCTLTRFDVVGDRG